MLRRTIASYLHNGSHEFLRAVLYMIRSIPSIIRDAIVNAPEKLVVADKYVDFDAKGDTQQADIIFSTSTGLYVFNGEHGICRKILSGKYYGVTRCGDYWFVARSNGIGPKNKRVSTVYRVLIHEKQPAIAQTILFAIPSEIHQIDVINSVLFIPHTGFNQILSMSLKQCLSTKTPGTLLSCKITNVNIHQKSHLNSIFSNRTPNYTMLVAHNMTSHTGKMSDLVTLDLDSGKVHLKNTRAASAHNIYYDDHCTLYCDSQNKTLIRNEEALYTSDKLLRGLSITDSHIYVGGSDICFDRDKRFSTEASIYILNKRGEEVGRLDFPRLGNLFEIRQFSGADHAMCASR